MSYVEDLRSVIGHQSINLVATTVVVVNELNEILLQKRKEPFGAWGLPGGLIELGESTEAAGIREVYEETNLVIENLKLIGVYSGEPEHHIRLKNGDEYDVVLIAYYSKCFTGRLCADGDETLACKFFKLTEIPETLLARHRGIIEAYLDLDKPNKD